MSPWISSFSLTSQTNNYAAHTSYRTAWFVHLDMHSPYMPDLQSPRNLRVCLFADVPTQNLFTDVLILILPISTIWTLNMSLQRRVAVLVVLTTGGSAVLTGGLRAIILFEFASSPDFTWSLGKMVIISNVELSVGILAANMPALKAFWTCWRQNKLGRGKGLSLSNGGSGRDEALSGSHNALEMNNRSNLGSRNDMGRAERLHSTESEEKLWDLHKPGMRKRDYEVSAQGQ